MTKLIAKACIIAGLVLCGRSVQALDSAPHLTWEGSISCAERKLQAVDVHILSDDQKKVPSVFVSMTDGNVENARKSLLPASESEIKKALFAIVAPRVKMDAASDAFMIHATNLCLHAPVSSPKLPTRGTVDPTLVEEVYTVLTGPGSSVLPATPH